jgi:hypothetical protein
MAHRSVLEYEDAPSAAMENIHSSFIIDLEYEYTETQP